MPALLCFATCLRLLDDGLLAVSLTSMRPFALLVALLLVLARVSAAAAPPDEEAAAVEDPSDAEVKEAREEFNSIDTNGDGFISREEILEMDEVPERDEIDEFFNTYDLNADGRVTFDEILKADESVCSQPLRHFCTRAGMRLTGVRRVLPARVVAARASHRRHR